MLTWLRKKRKRILKKIQKKFKKKFIYPSTLVSMLKIPTINQTTRRKSPTSSGVVHSGRQTTILSGIRNSTNMSMSLASLPSLSSQSSNQNQLLHSRRAHQHELSLPQVMSRVRADFMLRDKDKSTLQRTIDDKMEQLDEVMNLTNSHVKKLGQISAKLAFQKRKIEIAVNYVDLIKDSNNELFSNDISTFENTINDLINILQSYINTLDNIKSFSDKHLVVELNSVSDLLVSLESKSNEEKESLELLTGKLTELENDKVSLECLKDASDEEQNRLSTTKILLIADKSKFTEECDDMKIKIDDANTSGNQEVHTLKSKSSTTKDDIILKEGLINTIQNRIDDISQQVNSSNYDTTKSKETSLVHIEESFENIQTILLASSKNVMELSFRLGCMESTLQEIVSSIDSNSNRLRLLDSEIFKTDEKHSLGKAAVNDANFEKQKRIGATQRAVDSFFQVQSQDQQLRWKVREKEQQVIKTIEMQKLEIEEIENLIKSKQLILLNLHSDAEDITSRTDDNNKSITSLKLEVSNIESNMSDLITSKSQNQMNEAALCSAFEVMFEGIKDTQSVTQNFLMKQVNISVLKHEATNVHEDIQKCKCHNQQIQKQKRRHGKEPPTSIKFQDSITSKLHDQLQSVQSATYPVLVAQREKELEQIRSEIKQLQQVQQIPAMITRSGNNTNNSNNSNRKFEESRPNMVTTNIHQQQPTRPKSKQSTIETMDWFADNGVSFGLF